MPDLHEYLVRYRANPAFRSKQIQRASSLVNFLFCGAYLVNAVRFCSLWFGAISIYYLSLGAVRLFILRSAENTRKRDELPSAQYMELICCRRCGYFMFWLQIAMTGIIVQSILQHRNYEYPGHLIYLSALFTFCRFTTSIVGFVRSTGMSSPLIAATNSLGLAASLMAVFTLQVAMISDFGKNGSVVYILNSIIGGGICIAVLCLAASMIIQSNRRLREMQ